MCAKYRAVYNALKINADESFNAVTKVSFLIEMWRC